MPCYGSTIQNRNTEVNCPLLALAIGAFGIGTTEFSPMGLLPIIAKGVDVSIPATSMLISAYAVGVMVGVPLMTLLLSHRARRSALISLMAIFALGNVFSAISSDYTTLMLSRILASLNHEAFFGLGSMAATGVVSKHKQTSAVATMFIGLTIASIDGVPAATWLGETIGWRISFMTTAGLGVIVVVSLFFSLPKGGVGRRPDVRNKLAVLMCPQVLPALLTTVLGARAMFTLYTYISLVLHATTHATPTFVTGMLVLIGVGFSIGNYFGGKLADRSVSGTLEGFLLLLMVIMLAIPFLARNGLGATVNMVVWGAATFAVVPPLQIRVTCVTSGAPGLSSSVNIGVFSLGSALGTTTGGAVMSSGLDYSSVPVMGVIMMGLALLLVFVSARRQLKEVFTTTN